jgi:hypothetical protein
MQKLHVILEIHGQFQDSGISRISCDRSHVSGRCPTSHTVTMAVLLVGVDNT